MSGSRWVRWVAIGLAAALLLGVGLAAFALTAEDTPVEGDLASARLVEARLARIESLTYGTWAQHSAGAYLDYVAATAKVEPCMAAEGETLGYRFIDPYAGRPDYVASGTVWASPLLSTVSSDQALAFARYRWQEARLGQENPDISWDQKTRSYQRAYRKCRHLHENHPQQPRGYLDVSSDLHRLVDGLEQEVGSVDDYDRCMLAAGYDIYYDDHGGPDAMHELLDAQAPRLDASPGELVKSDQWARYLAFEQELLLADYDCRVDQFIAVMMALDAPLAEFEQAHADEIATMQQAWQDIEDEARRAGWTPTARAS